MAKLLYSGKRNFDHISRYAPYRTIVNTQRNLTYFESINQFTYRTGADTIYHVVEANQEGRLDIISTIYFGTPSYFWAIAAANNIIDPLTIIAGTVLLIPSLDSLYDKGAPLEKV